MQASPTDDASSRPAPDADAEPSRVPAPGPGRPDSALLSALSEFASARIALARLEARDAARHSARKGMLAAGVLVAAGFAWALLLAGGLGLAAAKGMPWHWLAIGTGLLHLLAGLVLGILLALPAPPAFPLTRTELEKDRAWLDQLKQNLKSRD